MSTMLGKDMCFGFAMLAGGQELGTLIFILSFGPWAIVHGGQKIESAQKIHASRG